MTQPLRYMSLLQPLFVVVAKELSVDNKQDAVASEQDAVE
jgi:hypothetical protein